MRLSLTYKLLILILPLCLIPLLGISIFAYQIAKERITEDRIVLYLEQIAQDIADTIRLTLLEKKEETVAMTLHDEFRRYLAGTGPAPHLLLDQLILVHEVYDLLVLVDGSGRIVLCNRISRSGESLNPQMVEGILGRNILEYTPDRRWMEEISEGSFGFLEWHSSKLIAQLYDYQRDDVSRQFTIGFAAPVLDERGGVMGGVLALMNWQYVQEILDKVEDDLEARSLTSGYAFLFGSDGDTIIGHKYRLNRYYGYDGAGEDGAVNNYGKRLVADLDLGDLQRAVSGGQASHAYQYPPGTAKISGLAPVNHEFFQWVCGVGINDEDIFAPVQDLKRLFVWTSSLTALLVLVLTYSAARRITTPLKHLTRGAAVIEGGDYSHRVRDSSRDEIGELSRSFNEMARSLEERSGALIELNRRLEEKVRERTRELEATARKVEKAYQELKETQVQLVQSEKMASLGQLVAGIAHEIKNPLNFIYGNTEFLRRYVTNLKSLVEESEERLEPEARDELTALKKSMNFDFMLEDLDTLIANFEEGAQRIHSIIGDLRTFSRMETDQFRPVDIHEPIDLALNLLHNQYRDRIRIHREYSPVPKVECHPGRLSQVFMNLVANACQSIANQGDVWIRTGSSNGTIYVEVEDTGSGIERDHLSRIFEPFFTTKPVGQGTGLGLSISYGIIQQHQGTIEVKSEVGKGTLFRVRLPVKS